MQWSARGIALQELVQVSPEVLLVVSNRVTLVKQMCGGDERLLSS